MRIITGHDGLRFSVDDSFNLNSGFLISLFLLTTLCALGALFFGFVLSLTKQAFVKVYAPHFLKPALGGFAIGLIGLYLPYIHEPAAYPLMVDLLSLSQIPLTLLIILFLIKIFATGITLGSGGSGGIFAPLLLTGAIVGAVTGLTLQLFGVTTALPVLAVFGMAIMFAAAAHAPLTAAVITIEMIGLQLSLIPWLFIACYAAVAIAFFVRPESIYHSSSHS